MFRLGICATHAHSRLMATDRRGRRPWCTWVEEGVNKVCTTHAEHRQSQEGRTCRTCSSAGGSEDAVPRAVRTARRAKPGWTGTSTETPRGTGCRGPGTGREVSVQRLPGEDGRAPWTEGTTTRVDPIPATVYLPCRAAGSGWFKGWIFCRVSSATIKKLSSLFCFIFKPGQVTKGLLCAQACGIQRGTEYEVLETGGLHPLPGSWTRNRAGS